MKAYLANGLFSIGDRFVNEKIAEAVRRQFPQIDLYVPQENTVINDKNSFASSLQIARADLDQLNASDVLIAVIDGIEVDSGVAAEIGVFSTFNRPIIALFTDVRQLGRENEKKINALINDATENQFIYRNLFVMGLIKGNGKVVSSIADVVGALKEYIK